MRHNPMHAVTDEQVVRTLIAENPWATIVSATSDGIVASHYPVLLDEEGDELAIVTHVGRPDEKIHELGNGEVLLIVAGPHGYISPSWYAPGATRAPTWNFSVAHCYGTPQILSVEDNKRVLARLVAHFEDHVERPLYLDDDVADKLGRGTMGFRLPIERFVCKVKMSQDKDAQTQQQVLDMLRTPGPYANAHLADDMQRELARTERSA